MRAQKTGPVWRKAIQNLSLRWNFNLASFLHFFMKAYDYEAY